MRVSCGMEDTAASGKGELVGDEAGAD